MRAFNENHWPIENAVCLNPGKKNAIAVFEDPNCGYCQKLDEMTLSKLSNTTVYVFFFPFLGEDSVYQSAQILSAQNPALAYRAVMVEGQRLDVEPTKEAMKKVQANIELANELGIHGTPAIYLGDGVGPFGFISYDNLKTKILAQA